MSLQQRQAEILDVLAEHPMGLSTAQITRDASSKPGSELPKDTGVVGNLIHTMRAAGLITSHDQNGSSLRLHKLTEKGREAIGAEMPAFAKAIRDVVSQYESAGAEVDSDYQEIAEPISTPAPQTVLTLDPENDIDAPFIQIISTLKAALNTTTPVKMARRRVWRR